MGAEIVIQKKEACQQTSIEGRMVLNAMGLARWTPQSEGTGGGPTRMQGDGTTKLKRCFKGWARPSRHLLPCRRKAPPAESPAKFACLKRRSRVASASRQNAIALLQVFALQRSVRSGKMLALL